MQGFGFTVGAGVVGAGVVGAGVAVAVGVATVGDGEGEARLCVAVQETMNSSPSRHSVLLTPGSCRFGTRSS